MIFSQREIETLRLLCQCQIIDRERVEGILSSSELQNLMVLKFVSLHEESGAYIPTNGGRSFVRQLFGSSAPMLSRSYHKEVMMRRLRLSSLVLTAYRSGIDPFTATVDELESAPTLFITSLARTVKMNPWGGTRIAALAHLGDHIFGCYCLYPGIGKLPLTDELTAFNNQTSHIKGVGRALLFAGESYKTILSELRAPASKTDSKLLTYGDAYRSLNLAVHLLSCDDIGATQLQLMTIPDYRRVLTQAALLDRYQPAPKEIPTWDAIFDSTPFVMAADMDLRRIDAALEMARVRGYVQVTLACLEEQARAVLISQYQKKGVRFVRLTRETLTKALGHPPVLYTPPHTQYLTEKGDVVDVPHIQAAGKTGKAHRKAGGRHRS